MKKFLAVAFLFFLFFNSNYAQIAGSFNVPGSFPTVAAAVNTLNLMGVAGPVTINVVAGHTETVPVGGLTLINPPGSSTTTILFKKQGAGANPILYAYTGGTATSNSAKRDGIWMFVDCKNITVDAIDLVDNNTTSPAEMEFGYGFYKSFSGGNCFNTIRNCSITLSGTNLSLIRGIDMTTSYYLTNTMTIVPSSTATTNSYNKFYNNFIQKCSYAISIVGYNLGSFWDIGNDVGGLSAVTGNTIVGFSDGGIVAPYQSQFNASYNSINNITPALSWVQGIYANNGIGATINSNTISLSSTGNWGSLDVINQSSGGTATTSISNNVFPVLSQSSGFSATSHSVITCSGNSTAYVNNNQIPNFTSSTGTVNLITVIGGNVAQINNNSITSATINGQGTLRGITSTSGTQEISNNYLSNLLAYNSTATSIDCINSPWGGNRTVLSNTITNIRGSGLNGIVITGSFAATTYSIANNEINDFALAPTSTIGTSYSGIVAQITNTTSGSITIRNNRIHDFSGRGQVYGIISAGAANNYLFQNRIYNLLSTGLLNGIASSGTQNHIYNNLIGGIGVTSSGPINALNLSNTNKVYFNSIYMNAAGSTNATGTDLISCLGTGANIELRNNILVNATTGPGISSILVVNTVLPTSDNNCFYYGTGHLMRFQPTTTVLSGYQSIFGSDAKSFIENPNFVSLTGSNPNFLNINTTIPTQIESGAASISTITTDYIGTIRSATPDVGAWEGNYIMADASSPTVATSGFTGPPCNTTIRTFTANLTDSSAIATGTLSPRLYYRVNFTLYSSVQGTLTSGTTKNGVWTFPVTYTANIGDVIWYFLVAQDTSYLKNVRIIPSAGATVTDVNTVNVPPNPAFNYTIQTAPTISISVTNTTICTGQSFVIVPSGASSYSYFPGGSATVSPTINTTYSVSGESSLGCPSTNTETLSVTVAACTGIRELKKGELKLWPNPTTDGIYVEQNGEMNKLQIQISDATGRIIFQNAISESSSYIDLSNHVDGIYFVEISNEKQIVFRTKLVIAR